jgi:hypothetical protein
MLNQETEAFFEFQATTTFVAEHEDSRNNFSLHRLPDNLGHQLSLAEAVPEPEPYLRAISLVSFGHQ